MTRLNRNVRGILTGALAGTLVASMLTLAPSAAAAPSAGQSASSGPLTTLTAILEAAVEYELIDRNPARGRRRRLPAVTPRRPWLDRAEHIAALLAAAAVLDEKARVRRGQRRALLATLVFAGLRIGEALSLRWRDVDLARGTITVRAQ